MYQIWMCILFSFLAETRLRYIKYIAIARKKLP